jgi:hypothetical protein
MTDTCDPAGTGNPRLDCFGAHHCRAASSLVLKRVDINPGGEVRPRRECGPLPRFLVASADDRLRSDCSGGLAAYGDVVMAAWGGVECVRLFRIFAPDAVVLDVDLRWGGADGVLAYLCARGTRLSQCRTWCARRRVSAAATGTTAPAVPPG